MAGLTALGTLDAHPVVRSCVIEDRIVTIIGGDINWRHFEQRPLAQGVFSHSRSSIDSAIFR